MKRNNLVSSALLIIGLVFALLGQFYFAYKRVYVSDAFFPAWVSENFASVLEEAGVEVELLLLEAGHGFFTDVPLSGPANVQSLEAIKAFLAALFEE